MARADYGDIVTKKKKKTDLERGGASPHVVHFSAHAIVLAAALSGCVGQTAVPTPAQELTKAEPAVVLPTSPTKAPKIPAEEARFEGRSALTGVRISEGNAVNCAEIRTDDGVVHPVSGLSGAVAIGDRIAVTGTFGVSTSCVGRVLMIKTMKKL